MTKRPPVPPASRSPNGPGSDSGANGKITRDDAERAARKTNLEDQGDPGNIVQNTTNQGYQQDR
jgi:hypothetical protein